MNIQIFYQWTWWLMIGYYFVSRMPAETYVVSTFRPHVQINFVLPDTVRIFRRKNIFLFYEISKIKLDKKDMWFRERKRNCTRFINVFRELHTLEMRESWPKFLINPCWIWHLWPDQSLNLTSVAIIYEKLEFTLFCKSWLMRKGRGIISIVLFQFIFEVIANKYRKLKVSILNTHLNIL